MSQIYFGGSRDLQSHPAVIPVVQAVCTAGHQIHVGCQLGIDQQVITATNTFSPWQLHIFTVYEIGYQPGHVQGHHIQFAAGGPTSVPFAARLLRRSIAAFQGCGSAVFFEPGPGSFAVMREYIKQYPAAPVFVFTNAQPAPKFGGAFYLSSFHSFLCWQFVPQATPAPLF